jgi:hypothetical protein
MIRRILADPGRSYPADIRGESRPFRASPVTLPAMPTGPGVPDIFLSYNHEDQPRGCARYTSPGTLSELTAR